MQTEFFSEMGGMLLLHQNQSVADGSSIHPSFVLVILNNFVLIAWSSSTGDASCKYLPYQLSMVSSVPTMVVIDNGESGFDSEEEDSWKTATIYKEGNRRANYPFPGEVVTKNNNTGFIQGPIIGMRTL